jgi:hypothetical protein
MRMNRRRHQLQKSRGQSIRHSGIFCKMRCIKRRVSVFCSSRYNQIPSTVLGLRKFGLAHTNRPNLPSLTPFASRPLLAAALSPWLPRPTSPLVSSIFIAIREHTSPRPSEGVLAPSWPPRMCPWCPQPVRIFIVPPVRKFSGLIVHFCVHIYKI